MDCRAHVGRHRDLLPYSRAVCVCESERERERKIWHAEVSRVSAQVSRDFEAAHALAIHMFSTNSGIRSKGWLQWLRYMDHCWDEASMVSALGEWNLEINQRLAVQCGFIVRDRTKFALRLQR